jgi:hypothetical protein
MQQNLVNYPSFSPSGMLDGSYFGQNARTDEINARLNERLMTDVPLAPIYDPRPTPTKREYFPIVDVRSISSVSVPKYDDFSQEKTFYPGTRSAHPSGYMKNVDNESEIQNLNYRLKHSDDNVYIPSTNSELYRVSIPSRAGEHPYPNLSMEQTFSNPMAHNYLNPKIGSDLFYNNTRIQLKST